MHTNDTNSVRITRRRYTRGLALSLSKGFTLIELLVVIGVLGVLTSIATGYSRRSEVVIAIATDRAALAAAFSRAKALAIQTYQFPPTAPVPCGFGVRVSNTGFTIFKDLPPELPSGNGFEPCSDPPSGVNPFYTSANANERFKEYTFDTRLAIDLCYHDDTNSPNPGEPFCYFANSGIPAEFDILFTPPNPNVYFKVADPPSQVYTVGSGLEDAVFRFYRRTDLNNEVAEVVVSVLGQVSTN